MDIVVNHPKTKKSGTYKFNCPEDLQGLVKQFGDKVVANHAIAALKVAVQGIARGMLGAGKSNAEIQKAVGEYKPGLRVRGKSPQEKIAEQFGKMDPETKKALLRQLAGGK